jgi:hypothetical protein
MLNVRPMSWKAVELTRERAAHDKAENAKRGAYTCYRCADTHIAPAPEPYGSFGAVQPCPDCATPEMRDAFWRPNR